MKLKEMLNELNQNSADMIRLRKQTFDSIKWDQVSKSVVYALKLDPMVARQIKFIFKDKIGEVYLNTRNLSNPLGKALPAAGDEDSKIKIIDDKLYNTHSVDRLNTGDIAYTAEISFISGNDDSEDMSIKLEIKRNGQIQCVRL